MSKKAVVTGIVLTAQVPKNIDYNNAALFFKALLDHDQALAFENESPRAKEFSKFGLLSLVWSVGDTEKLDREIIKGTVHISSVIERFTQ